MVLSTAPAASLSNRCSRSAEFSREGPLVHSELARHDCERRAPLVPHCGLGNRLVGHLADHAPSRDAGLVEVVDDGGPVDLVAAGKSVDRDTLSIQADELFDLGSRQPALHRV